MSHVRRYSPCVCIRLPKALISACDAVSGALYVVDTSLGAQLHTQNIPLDAAADDASRFVFFNRIATMGSTTATTMKRPPERYLTAESSTPVGVAAW